MATNNPAASAAPVFALPALLLGVCICGSALAAHDGVMTHGSKAMPGHGKAGMHYAMKGMIHDMQKLGKSPKIHVVHMAGVARTVKQQIITDFLLAALKIEPEKKIKAISEARRHGGKVIKALRHGDPQLALPATQNSKVLGKLFVVEKLWAEFDSRIANSVATGHFSTKQVTAIAALSEPLFKASDAMVAAFERHAHGDHLVSILSQTVSVAQNQNSRLHRMNKEYLLIAYGHQVARYRASLAEDIAGFDRDLQALMNGSVDRHVLRAPSEALKAQFVEIQSRWNGYRQSIEGATRPDRISAENIGQTMRHGAQLASALTKAVTLYHAL